ncbi:MAG TPA: CapA family protein [Chryseosolibacter sp.]|nr:CapA family protein [Chryseosolibacter sp.]
MNDSLTIGLAGDVMIGRTIDKVIDQKGHNYPWGNLLPVMNGTDLNVINLETTLTNSNRKADKTFNFKASPDKVQSLLNANISVANLANNHILDFANEGMFETIQTLDKAAILHVGAGENEKEAAAPAIIMKKGLRIGVLGITDNEPSWKAESGPGTNYLNLEDPRDAERILQSITSLRKKTDVIILSIHWGPNMRDRPTREFIDFAHEAVNHGAKVIHGHSAHILQGIEIYNDSLILYDTGDFVDDYRVDSILRNDLSAYFALNIDGSGLIHLRITPTVIQECQVNRASKTDNDWVLQRIRQLSAPFGTHIDEDGKADFRAAPHKNKSEKFKL